MALGCPPSDHPLPSTSRLGDGNGGKERLCVGVIGVAGKCSTRPSSASRSTWSRPKAPPLNRRS